MRYFVSITYQGSKYSGWQIQDNAISIEEKVERALSLFFGENIDTVGAGRTDAGVNAINFIAHFDIHGEANLKEPSSTLYKINAILPPDITINNIYPVHIEAHARFDAISRTYRYFVHCGKDPFNTQCSCYCKFPLDMEAMNDAAAKLLGTKDFSCFEKLHGGNATSICNVMEAHWKRYFPAISAGESVEYMVFTITANRFLRNMVRAIVGSLIEIGRGRKEPQWICELLESKNRCAAGQSVPGHALFLTDIKYPYKLQPFGTLFRENN